MGSNEVRSAAERLLEQAQALRAAFPDTEVMRSLPVAEAVADAPGEASPVVAAMRCLRAEMLLVRDGRAYSLLVLDDEVACVRRALARL